MVDVEVVLAAAEVEDPEERDEVGELEDETRSAAT